MEAIYRTKARTAPPITAKEPLAKFATAALLDFAAAPLEVELDEEEVLVFEAVRLADVERVAFEAAVNLLDEAVLTMVVFVEADEVIFAELVVEAEYAVLLETTTVLVEVGLTEAVEDPPDALLLLLLLPATILNGLDHWKIFGSLSHEIWIPYSPKILMSCGMCQVYSCSEFRTPAK